VHPPSKSPESLPARRTGTCGRSYCAGFWTDTPTALGAGEVPVRFSITHPFHPLCDQQFELIGLHHNWHEDRVLFRARGEDRTESLPRRWTGRAPVDPFRERSAGRAWFSVEDLLCLVELVAALRQRQGEGGQDGV